MKIDIPRVLVHLRARVVDAKRARRRTPTAEALAMRAAGMVLAQPARLRAAQRAARIGGRLLAREGRIGALPLPAPLNGWSATRDLPQPPAETFRAWWQRTGDAEGKDQK